MLMAALLSVLGVSSMLGGNGAVHHHNHSRINSGHGGNVVKGCGCGALKIIMGALDNYRENNRPPLVLPEPNLPHTRLGG